MTPDEADAALPGTCVRTLHRLEVGAPHRPAKPGALVQRVSSQHERVTVTVHGRASAILLAPEDLERLGETITVLADAALLNKVSKAEADIEHGREDNAEELAARCSPIHITAAQGSCRL